MRQQYRHHDDRDDRQDEERRRRMRWGEDRDPYEAGNERRYLSDWNDRAPRDAFQGERSYPRSGYAEEVGYRRDYAPRDEDEQRRANRPQQRGPYGEFSSMRWSDESEGPDYYGTGSHYGGGFGTAPSSRVSAAGSWGAPGYGGQGAWSDRDDEWRNTSGARDSYASSQWGAQSGYGRSYGESTRSGAPLSTHRGRGPKGYERSDDRLREIICERLTDDPRIDASEVNVEVNQKVVRLTGVVDDRRTKYEIEDLVEHCGGVKEIDNQLRVTSRWGSGRAESPSGNRSASAADVKKK